MLLRYNPLITVRPNSGWLRVYLRRKKRYGFRAAAGLESLTPKWLTSELQRIYAHAKYR